MDIRDDFLKPDEIPVLLAGFLKAVLGRLAEIQAVSVALQEFYLFIQSEKELPAVTVPEQVFAVPGKKAGFPFDTYSIKGEISLRAYQVIEGKEADDAA